jgi:hypothetical protein
MLHAEADRDAYRRTSGKEKVNDSPLLADCVEKV